MLSIHYGETSIGKFAEPCHSLSLGTSGHGSPETTIPKGTCAFCSLGALLVANVGCMWLGPACRFYEILKKGWRSSSLVWSSASKIKDLRTTLCRGCQFMNEGVADFHVSFCLVLFRTSSQTIIRFFNSFAARIFLHAFCDTLCCFLRHFSLRFIF